MPKWALAVPIGALTATFLSACPGGRLSSMSVDAGGSPPADGEVSRDAARPPVRDADGAEEREPDGASDAGLDGQVPEAGSGPTDFPTVNGPCPDFIEGEDLTFHPKGVSVDRHAKVWIGPEANVLDGPTVFYWHGTGMEPDDAVWSIGRDVIDDIKRVGGIVVAPYNDPVTDGDPWFNEGLDDHLTADEIVACAQEKVGINTARIHSTGFSAGGWMAAHFAVIRSNYVASSSPHSGGIYDFEDVEYTDPANQAASMTFHGGPSDLGFGVSFKEGSENFNRIIRENGGFSIMCDHGRGHEVPTDAQRAIWQFFLDHPWNAGRTSAYAVGLPDSFPTYCVLD